MAELKAGTTINGSLVWTQGNFPLNPAGNTLLYKTYKVYTENDKPKAIDNDFVSKASGGGFLGPLSVKGTLLIPREDGNINGGGFKQGNGDGATIALANVDITSWYGIGIWASNTNTRTMVINARTGDVTSIGAADFTSYVSSGRTPINAAHLTRKDYVDGLINTTTNNANSRVLRAGDTMTGPLTAPNITSQNNATLPDQVPKLSQVVVKGTTLDYGTY